MKRRPLRLLRLLALLGLPVIASAAALFLYLRPLPVAVTPVETDIPVQVYGLGTVEARILSDVGFEVAGTLDELHADHGQRVAKGALLARLRSDEQEARVAQAEAKLAQAKADLRMAAARVAKAEAVLGQRRQTDRRRQILVRRGVVAAEAAEDARAELDIAAAELRLAESEVAQAEAVVADAAARLAMEQVLLRRHDLTAPYDAVVVARRRELGAVLTAGESLFTLIDAGTVWVLAYVDEALAGGLRVGQPAAIRLRSMPAGHFRGRVARIEIESDRVSEERRVYVACETCPADLHLGEQAEVVITTGRLDRAQLVPQAAVLGYDGQRGTVWTVEGGALGQRAVRFGPRTLDGRLAILDGLPPGAAVVGVLRPGLRLGRPVLPEEARS